MSSEDKKLGEGKDPRRVLRSGKVVDTTIVPKRAEKKQEDKDRLPRNVKGYCTVGGLHPRKNVLTPPKETSPSDLVIWTKDVDKNSGPRSMRSMTAQEQSRCAQSMEQ